MSKAKFVSLHNATWVAGGLYLYRVTLMDSRTREIFTEQYGAGSSIENAMRSAINSWGTIDDSCQDLDKLEVKSVELIGECSFTPADSLKMIA